VTLTAWKMWEHAGGNKGVILVDGLRPRPAARRINVVAVARAATALNSRLRPKQQGEDLADLFS
jgi:hypothetical protein